MISKTYSESKENGKMLEDKFKEFMYLVLLGLEEPEVIQGDLFQFKNEMILIILKVGENNFVDFQGKFNETGEQVLKSKGIIGLKRMWGEPVAHKKCLGFPGRIKMNKK
jgi:hypothetical protein